MIAKFNLKAMKSLKTFLVELLIFTKAMNAKKTNSQLVYAYQQRVESLNFAAVIFRSDIAFVTFKLIQYL
jgi:actin-related protein